LCMFAMVFKCFSSIFAVFFRHMFLVFHLFFLCCKCCIRMFQK
jgi:hypothetical protein